QAIIHNIEIISSFDDQDLWIWCDENSLKQVFINLIKNSLEAMQDGGYVHLITKRENDKIVIQVVDQGCGIPKDKLTLIGKPFYTTKENGTGLGMMISYNIIEQHQGQIHIQSEIEQGTTFTITLPYMDN
ncbi:MAG TPA: HAMP domain-containing sensor histidine kinase, partial [Bacillota bacterium]|nr:HAMP domain-containing sensor histidine kinase [Bacillota bacterium]